MDDVFPGVLLLWLYSGICLGLCSVFTWGFLLFGSYRVFRSRLIFLMDGLGFPGTDTTNGYLTEFAYRRIHSFSKLGLGSMATVNEGLGVLRPLI